MIEEAINRLVELGVEAAGMKVIHPEAEPGHNYWLHNCKTGVCTNMEADPQPRRHVAGDLDAIVQAAKHFILAPNEKDDAPPVLLWYSRRAVVLVCDDATRRDTVTLPLALSPQVVRLLELETKTPSMDQAAALKLLRTTFAACLQSTGNLVGSLRGVKWKIGDEGDSRVEHGKASMGRNLTAQLHGLDVLPEYITLMVPVFVSGVPAKQWPVKLALEPDPKTTTFQLIPLPGEIEAAIVEAEKFIGTLLTQELAESGVEVFYGQA